MPRPPNKDAKIPRLVLVAKEGQEEKIKAFKEICARNEIHVSDILFEKVEAFLIKHNWPPGNSQTLIFNFAEQPVKPLVVTCPKLERKDSFQGKLGWCNYHGKWVSEEQCLGCSKKG